MDYSYKILADSDINLLKELLNVFGHAFDDVRTYLSAVPSDSYLESLLSKRHFMALVALKDDQVVGGLAAYLLEKFEQERNEIYIYDLAVNEHHRRRNIATNLIEELKKIAIERKAYVVYVQADKEDAPAIKLYESLGKKEEVYHFDINIGA